MAKDEAKIKFTAETGEFTAGIAKANSSLGKLRAELRTNATEMKGAGESVEGLSQRHDLLQQEMEASQVKTEALAAKLDAAKRIFGENSTEADKWATQLANARTAEAKIQQEIDRCNAALEEQKNAANKAESALDKLESTISAQESDVSKLERAYKEAVIQFGKSSTEAKQLESKLSQANSELAESKSKMNKAEQAAKELARSLDDAGDSAADMGADVGDIAAGNVIADMATGAVTSLTGLEESTRQYRNEQSKLAAISQTTGQDLDKLKGQYTDLFAISGDETMASTAVANLTAMGMSAENTDRVLNIAKGTWAQYGDSIPLDGLAESINESSKLGATLTGPVVDAINWANMSQKEWGKSLSGNKKAQKAFNDAVKEGASTEDAMNAALAECTTEQQRQELLVGALETGYSDLAKSYDENNAKVDEANRADAALMESQAKLADKTSSLFTESKKLAAGGIGFLADNLDVIAPIAGAAGIAFGILAVAMNFGSIVSALSKAMGVLNAVMALNPAVLIVAGIVLLIGIFIALWNRCEGFRNFWIGLWDKIKSVAKSAWSGIKETATGIVNKFKEIKEKVSQAWQALKGKAVTLWNGIKTAISQPINAAKNVVSNVINGIKSAFNKIVAVKNTVVNVFNGIKTAISDKIEAAKEAVRKAIDKIKGFFDVKLKFPDIKLPHFDISGGKAPWGLGGKGKAPSIDIQWYAKGGILTRPTLFGMNGSNFMAGGEAGAEAVLPIATLMDYINAAFDRQFGALAGAGGPVYNVYVNDAIVNDDARIRDTARDFLVELARKGAM